MSLCEVKVEYEGSLRVVMLRHRPSDETTEGEAGTVGKYDIRLQESSSDELASTGLQTLKRGELLIGEADLSFASGQTKVFALTAFLREARDLQATKVTFSMANENFNIDLMQSFGRYDHRWPWWMPDGKGPKDKGIGSEDGRQVKILPKPPKMTLHLVDAPPQFYVDEQITVRVGIVNEEDEATQASLEVRVLGHSEHGAEVTWLGDMGAAAGESDTTSSAGKGELPGHAIGRLAQASSTTQTFRFAAGHDPVDYVVEIKVLYHLLSDLDTPVSKILAVDLPVIRPFEANYDFSPRVHPDPWPSFFDILPLGLDETRGSLSGGITQKWCLAAKIASFAAEPICMEAIDLKLLAIEGQGNCEINQGETTTDEPFDIVPKAIEEMSFDLSFTKLAPEDRRSATLDLYLGIKWRRQGSTDPVNLTCLPVPRLLVPISEPRVLAWVTYSTEIPGMIHLHYTLENPSFHMLTWSLSMDASEDFAFSGPKAHSEQIVPFSRRTILFNLLPTVRKKWIQPQLRVVDRYFNRTLKVSATENMRMDKKGILVWADVAEWRWPMQHGVTQALKPK